MKKKLIKLKAWAVVKKDGFIPSIRNANPDFPLLIYKNRKNLWKGKNARGEKVMKVEIIYKN